MAFTIESNQPSAGSIRWAGLNMQYLGKSYSIQNGYTNYIYAYWTPATPNNLVVSNTFPTLGTDDCLVFLNKGGIAVTVPNSTVLTGDLIAPGSIITSNLAANCITTTQLATDSVTANAIAANAIGANAIAAGVITADKLKAYSITANKLLIGDTNNLCNLNPDNADLRNGYTVVKNTTDSLNYFKIGTAAYASMELFRSYNNEIKLGDEYSFSAYGVRDSAAVYLECRYYYTDGTYDVGGSVTVTTNIPTGVGMILPIPIKMTKSPNTAKIFNYSYFFIYKGNDTTTSFHLRDIKLYKRYAGELLVDGTITSKQIATNSILAQNLNVSDIFANTAVINSIQATDLKAEQIKAGTISNDRLNLKGFISFESLSSEFDGVFDLSNPTQTYINGNRILTGSITADKVNTRGLVSKNNNNEVTFEIKEDTGDIVINNAFFKSSNFIEGNTGYRLSTDGNAEFNQATIRGKVVLPNAGITNDYDMSQIEGRNLVKRTEMKEKWSDWQSSRGVQSITENGLKVVAIATGQTAIVNYLTITPIIGEKFTLTFRARGSVNQLQAFMIASSGGNQGIYTKTGSTVINSTTFTTISFTFTFNNTNTAPTNRLFIGGTFAAIDEWFEIEKNSVKLEYGEIATTWTSAPEDDLNPVRIWAGTDESSKDTAPFRVMQDGSVYATRGNFEGTFSGEVNVGNIKIFDTINSDSYIQMYDNSNSRVLSQISGEKDTFFGSNFYIKKNNGGSFKIIDVYNDSSGWNDLVTIYSDLKTSGDDSKYVYFPSKETENLIEMGTLTGKLTIAIDNGVRFSTSEYSGETPNKFVFEKSNGTPIDFNVMGNLYVRDEFKIGDNGMKIVGLTDTNGKGYDFIVI